MPVRDAAACASQIDGRLSVEDSAQECRSIRGNRVEAVPNESDDGKNAVTVNFFVLSEVRQVMKEEIAEKLGPPHVQCLTPFQSVIFMYHLSSTIHIGCRA